MTLRRRLFLALIPLLLLPVVVGGVAAWQMLRLSRSAEAILRENYVSVRAMERLNEAVERIDSAFQFALAGQEAEARSTFLAHWADATQQIAVERANVTVYPDEPRLMAELATEAAGYRAAGDRFFAAPAAERRGHYFEPHGLYDRFSRMKVLASSILRLNQEEMERASQQAKADARQALGWLGGGVAVAGLVAAGLAIRLARDVLTPVQGLTTAARALATGDLTHRVDATTRGDELGELGRAFNDMADQLWLVRQTNVTQLMRARAAAQAVIDSLPGPVLLVDPGGTVELANPAARRVFGVEPGRGWIPPDQLRRPLADALDARTPFVAERFDQALQVRDESGELALLPQVRPVSNPAGAVVGAAVVLDDVTRFRLLDQLKGDFVATAGHELKTPLTGLQLAVHLLLEEAAGPLTAKQAELLSDARENAERLRALVDQLLALARLEDRRELLSIRPQPPDELLRAAADAAAVRAADKNVTLTVDVPPDLPLVAADPARLGTALDNLLTNAVTHAPVGGAVTLSAFTSDNMVSLIVADTGPGIPIEYRSQVFERFFRVPDPTQPTGTGLGLSIVREIAEAHGGTVQCDSSSAGTTFTLTLPVWRGTT